MKKYITWSAWTVIFSGLIVLFLLGRFSSENSEPTLVNNVISTLAFLAIFLSLFGYLAVAIKDYFFRSSQMRGLAEKYNLNYTTPKEPFTMTPKAIYKKNIIEGKINGKEVLVYDYVRWYWLAHRSSITRSATIISFDGRKIELRGFFTGLCSVKDIDNILIELSKEK